MLHYIGYNLIMHGRFKRVNIRNNENEYIERSE